MRPDETKQFTSADESISQDEAAVVQALRSLPRIEAPKDFDFHLKARIARGAPQRQGIFSLIPKAAYLAPAALAVVIGAYLGFGYLGEHQNSQVAAVDPAPVAQESRPTPAIPSEPANLTVASAPRVEEAQPSRVPARNRDAELRVRQAAATEESAGGSRTSTLREPNKVIMPRGFERSLAPQTASNTNTDSGSRTSVREMLSLLGIDAVPGSGGWTVRSAQVNGTAERSGIKAGDVIEAIDEKAIGADTGFSGNITFKTLRVLRDGKSVTVTLANR